MFKISCLLFLCVILSLGTANLIKEFAENSEWTLFKNEFSRSYNSDVEEEFRYKIFLNNLMKIEEHNKKYDEGLVTYYQGVNEFSDQLFVEYLEEISYGDENFSKDFDNQPKLFIPESVKVPDEIDWSQKGAVTHVKQQGKCGSCYAFAAIGALESANWKRHGKLISLSEQNIVDCSKKYKNHGCKGGSAQRTYKYIKKNKGVNTEASYPYTGVEGQCKFNQKTVGAKIKGYLKLKSGDENNMKRVVAENGPVAVSIDAANDSFRHYKGGVYYEPSCSSNTPSHAVLVVGYGTENGLDYWKIKNSWRSSWGEKGYAKMARNKNNNCGIATHGIYPQVL